LQTKIDNLLHDVGLSIAVWLGTELGRPGRKSGSGRHLSMPDSGSFFRSIPAKAVFSCLHHCGTAIISHRFRILELLAF
jgi:hypothetical protein